MPRSRAPALHPPLIDYLATEPQAREQGNSEKERSRFLGGGVWSMHQEVSKAELVNLVLVYYETSLASQMPLAIYDFVQQSEAENPRPIML